LIERMMRDRLPVKVANAKSMQEAFELLRSYPSFGDFLAYQITIDLNYGKLSFSENDFVVAGPGARDGIRKCFADAAGFSDADVIRYMVDSAPAHFERLGLAFRDLWGRSLHLIDCQNLFCELDKYARVTHPELTGASGRHRIKQKFRTNPSALSQWYPPKWGIKLPLALAPVASEPRRARARQEALTFAPTVTR
jgi:hypothetical protein